ncbi:TPA: hypothetical protein ACWV4M_004338 [Salmonella enterica subsp. enterica serovar Muenchen]
MTGSLTLRSDDHVCFAIANANGQPRMQLYRDLNGVTTLNNGGSNGANFFFHLDGRFYAPAAVRVGTKKYLSVASSDNSALNAYFNLWGSSDRPTVIELDDEQGWHLYSQRNIDGSIRFTVNGDIGAGRSLYAGNATFAADGNIYGTRWNANGAWLWDSIAEQFTARDNNINTRATWDWVNQHFVQDVRLAAPVEFSERGLTERVWGGVVTSWADYGGSNYHIKWRLLQKLINGQWLTVAYA